MDFARTYTKMPETTHLSAKSPSRRRLAAGLAAFLVIAAAATGAVNVSLVDDAVIDGNSHTVITVSGATTVTAAGATDTVTVIGNASVITAAGLTPGWRKELMARYSVLPSGAASGQWLVKLNRTRLSNQVAGV